MSLDGSVPADRSARRPGRSTDPAEPADPATPGRRRARTVVAVVVTYNREELLAQCLDALQAQTRRPDAVVVIDNASTDGSGPVADQHPVADDVVHLRRNVGGAGGFAAGIARALETHGADWVWVMDDDTVAGTTALAELLRALDAAPVRLTLLSSRAVWTDGREHPMNRSRTRLGAGRQERADAALIGGYPVRTASYVSVMMHAEDIRRLGLPNADYFIWSDDFEHTGRLLRHGRGVHVPASVVEHRTAAFAGAQSSPGDRFYFDVRNRIWALLRSESFTALEKTLYGGRTLLAWIRLLLTHRGRLPAVAIRGLAAALRRGPRPSAQVLGADPEIAAQVRRIDQMAGRR